MDTVVMGTGITDTEVMDIPFMNTVVMNTVVMDRAVMGPVMMVTAVREGHRGLANSGHGHSTQAHGNHAQPTGAFLLNPLADWRQVPTPPWEFSSKLIPA